MIAYVFQKYPENFPFQLNSIRKNIGVSAIISTLSGEIKNRRDFDAFDDTHMEELVVY